MHPQLEGGLSLELKGLICIKRPEKKNVIGKEKTPPQFYVDEGQLCARSGHFFLCIERHHRPHRCWSSCLAIDESKGRRIEKGYFYEKI